jgi:hypothetical protein
VDVIDNTGAVIVPLSIIHASVNAFTVTFSASTTGIILSSTGDSGTDGADGDGTAYYGQLSRTTSGTVSSISAGVYKSTGLAGTLGTEVYGFERGTDQMSLKNVSGEPILCRFYASADIEAGNNKVLGIKLALDGVLIDETECRAATGVGTTFAKLVTSWIIEVADGEEVALYVANHTTTDNLTVQRCRLIAATVGRQGEQGIQGETGDAGADALWNFTGAYSGGSAYAIGDVATYDGQTWYRINANGGNVGDTPAEGTFWTLIAAEGATGPTGPGSKTLIQFSPRDNQPPASNFATLDTRNSIAALDFDAATKETTVFVGVIPQGADLTSGLSISIFWMATTATSGDCRWEVALERGNTDLDSDSFDTAQVGTTTTSGTSGITNKTTINLTTIDSVVAGEFFRLRVARDAANAGDTMAGDAELLAVEIQQIA